MRWLSLLLLFAMGCDTSADEIRPGYLQMQEITPEVFSVVWKLPAKGARKLGLELQLPDNCDNHSQPQTQRTDTAWIQRWLVSCEGGLQGRIIEVAGLALTSTDVLLQLQFINGSEQSLQLTPTNSQVHVAKDASTLQVAATYTTLGIKHILQGFDHLAFVFALLLIVRDWRVLLGTITAFTVAHSITLAGATLGWMQVPQQPVEAVIALSILFLAMEWVHGRQGRPGAAARWPWLIAFTFGLLHGFGFAGALAEVGLPQHAIPLALVFFNVGVELGQLLFIAAVLLIGWLLHKLQRPKLLFVLETFAIYGIGSMAAFWLIQRVSAF